MSEQTTRKPFDTIRGIAEEYARLTPETSKTIQAIANRALAEVEQAEWAFDEIQRLGHRNADIEAALKKARIALTFYRERMQHQEHEGTRYPYGDDVENELRRLLGQEPAK